MAYKRVVAAAFLAALMAAGSVQAQSSPGCRKKCDATFSGCSKRAKAGDSVCLRTWHKCKAQCTAAAAATPARVQTTALAATQAKRR